MYVLELSMASLFSFCQMAARFSAMAFVIPASAAREILIFNSRASANRLLRNERLAAFLGAGVDEWDAVMTGLFLLHPDAFIYAHSERHFLRINDWNHRLSQRHLSCSHVVIRFPAGKFVDFFAVAAVELDEGTDGAVADLELVEQLRDVVNAWACRPFSGTP